MALSKLRLGQLKPADGSTTVGDVHFPKVTALLPLNGSNGGTSATDESNSNATVTFQGSSTTSTAQSKFGGSSLYVPNSHPAGVYISGVGSSITFTADFTIEWWVYRVQATTVAGQVIGPIIGSASVSNHSGNYLAMSLGYLGSAATEALLYSSSNGSSWNIASGVSLGTGSAGTVGQWVHMALTRSGTTWSFYVDGTRTYTGTLGSATLSTPGTYLTLGKSWDTTANFEAYYSDFRITQGLARYTGASVTVPTSAHLTSAGDVNKHIIVNSDADGVAIGTGGINQARIAKAWAEFDGSGITLNASYNVSSITDHGNRDYTINFSTAMTDTNYSIVGSNIGQTASYNWSVVTGMGTAKTTSAARINVPHINDSSLYGNDPDAVNVIAFGN